MDVELITEISGVPDEAELRSLADWLRQETPRPGRIELAAAEPQPGEMGAISETLQVALGAGGAATVLAGSVGTWIKSRQQAVRVRLRRGDGEELLIEGSVKDPEQLIDQFLKGVQDLG